jgi:hypothetical protein
MIDRIKTKDNMLYDTIVFAKIKDGWESKVIGFNMDLDRLEIINIWSTKKTLVRNVVIIDHKKIDWIIDEHVEGYEWIIYDTNLLEKIRDKKEIDNSIIEKCKEMQDNIMVKEWNIIKTNPDIDNILAAALDFHDSFVEKIDIINDNNLVEVTFDAWGCKIIIRFENDVEIKCEEIYGQMGEIFDATIFFEDNFIYWVDCKIESSKDIEQDFRFFKSRKAYWEIVIV